MSTLVDFTPTSLAVFSFLAQFADGGQYTVACPWNAFGERWYVRVSDLSGTVIGLRPITQSGPVFQATLTWFDGLATAVLDSPHNVAIGALASARIFGTNTGYDGDYSVLAIDLKTFTFDLPIDPSEPTAITGKLDFPLDLLAGTSAGPLYFHADTQQFEF